MLFTVQVTNSPYVFNDPIAPTTFPCVCLVQNEWDDYGYKGSFRLFFFDENGERMLVGDTKIVAGSVGGTTVLPERFDSPLADSYCSLGQDLGFYKQMAKIEESARADIFAVLRDVVADPELARRHKDSSGFRNCLLRFSEAEKALKEGGRYFGRLPLAQTGFAFSFQCLLLGFARPHDIAFDFTQKDAHPHRITAFVGKNGVGKSGVLASLASAFSGFRKDAGKFAPGRPEFGRTICVSYSVFQPFDVPQLNTTSYRYCGLRNERGVIALNELNARTTQSISRIWQTGRKHQWHDLMSLEDIFMGALPAIEDGEEATLSIDDVADALRVLSSGQRIVVSILSDLLEHIDEQSLILFDEPEIYLHPTLLSTLLRLLHKLLENFDSYAVIATHSPIVVQEIPARSVRVFLRESGVPIVQQLPVESLGANLTDVVDMVFAMNDDDKNYKSILRELAQNHTFDEIVALFEGKLSLNARMLLKSFEEQVEVA